MRVVAMPLVLVYAHDKEGSDVGIVVLAADM